MKLKLQVLLRQVLSKKNTKQSSQGMYYRYFWVLRSKFWTQVITKTEYSQVTADFLSSLRKWVIFGAPKSQFCFYLKMKMITEYCEIIFLWEQNFVDWQHWTFLWTIEFVYFKLFLIYIIWMIICWDLKFVDCPTHKRHKIKYPMKIKFSQ